MNPKARPVEGGLVPVVFANVNGFRAEINNTLDCRMLIVSSDAAPKAWKARVAEEDIIVSTPNVSPIFMEMGVFGFWYYFSSENKGKGGGFQGFPITSLEKVIEYGIIKYVLI